MKDAPRRVIGLHDAGAVGTRAGVAGPGHTVDHPSTRHSVDDGSFPVACVGAFGMFGCGFLYYIFVISRSFECPVYPNVM